MRPIAARPALRCAFAAMTLFWLCQPAHANGIALPVALMYAFGTLIPLMIFLILLEGLVYYILLKCDFRGGLAISGAANLVSLFAGLPVALLNSWLLVTLLPSEITAYVRWYLLGAAGAVLLYFLVTYAAEYWVLERWRKERQAEVSRGRVATTLLLANVITYAVLAPAYIYGTWPARDIRTFTPNTAWAADPPSRLYFVDSASRNLCTILSNGEDRQVVISDTVLDYQLQQEDDRILYRNGEGTVVLWTSGQGARSLFGTDDTFDWERVACGPEGKWVAYLKELESDSAYSLIVFDVASGAEHALLDADTQFRRPRIGRTVNSDTIVVNTGYGLYAYSAEQSDTSARVPLTPSTGEAVCAYQPQRRGYSHHELGDVRVSTHWGLDSGVYVSVGDEDFRFIENTTGFLGFARSWITAAQILDNGREVVFENGRGIYLLDVDDRKVGLIVASTKLCMKASQFQIPLLEMRE